jgi:hypothetical protein
MQRRGLIPLHAVIWADGSDGAPPPETAEQLAVRCLGVARAVQVPHPYGVPAGVTRSTARFWIGKEPSPPAWRRMCRGTPLGPPMSAALSTGHASLISRLLCWREGGSSTDDRVSTRSAALSWGSVGTLLAKPFDPLSPVANQRWPRVGPQRASHLHETTFTMRRHGDFSIPPGPSHSVSDAGRPGHKPAVLGPPGQTAEKSSVTATR